MAEPVTSERDNNRIEESFIEESRIDDEAILQLTNASCNANPTNNTNTAQNAKLLFSIGNLIVLRQSQFT